MIRVLNKKTDKSDSPFYIGRGSVLGNPFDWTGSTHPQVKYRVKNRDEAISNYDKYLEEELKNGNPEICDAINDLIIKKFKKEPIDLMCFCSPQKCHGEVIKKNVEESRFCINWFSNMRGLDSPFLYQGIQFHTVENFYQAMKMPKDRPDLRAEIAALNPYKSKKEIRKKEKYPWREDWDKELSIKVMRYGLKQKFKLGTSWGLKLLNYNKDIVEWNNWRDTFWGKDIYTGEGENWLGKLLMEIKEEIY